MASDLALEYGDRLHCSPWKIPVSEGSEYYSCFSGKKKFEIKKEIQGSVVQGISKNQKDAYLREQLHVIQEALGEGKHQELKNFSHCCRMSGSRRWSERKLRKSCTISLNCPSCPQNTASTRSIWSRLRLCHGSQERRDDFHPGGEAKAG
ncbi:MAG: hypothetical protein ACLR23_16350 [Clostridia bacterium]